MYGCDLMALKRRYYISEMLYFEIYDDGTVIMFYHHQEVARKELHGSLSDSNVRAAFEEELQPITAPEVALPQMAKDIAEIKEGVNELRKRKST